MLEFNEETKQAIRDAEEGKNLLGPFYSAEEMMEALLGDDYEKYYDDEEQENDLEHEEKVFCENVV